MPKTTIYSSISIKRRLGTERQSDTGLEHILYWHRVASVKIIGKVGRVCERPTSLKWCVLTTAQYAD